MKAWHFDWRAKLLYYSLWPIRFPRLTFRKIRRRYKNLRGGK